MGVRRGQGGGFRGDGRAQRAGPSLQLRALFILVCEGEKTEPYYFRGLRDAARLARDVDVQVLDNKDAGGTDPQTLVTYAKSQKATRMQEEKRLQKREGAQLPAPVQVWCVFDRDQHESFDGACADARHSGIRLAVSNPCFELWYLLHFGYRDAAIHRHDAPRRLRDDGHIGGYDKSMPGLWQRLLPRLATAMRNARRLRAKAISGGNPSTDVDLLLEELGLCPEVSRDVDAGPDEPHSFGGT